MIQHDKNADDVKCEIYTHATSDINIIKHRFNHKQIFSLYM